MRSNPATELRRPRLASVTAEGLLVPCGCASETRHLPPCTTARYPRLAHLARCWPSLSAARSRPCERVTQGAPPGQRQVRTKRSTCTRRARPCAGKSIEAASLKQAVSESLFHGYIWDLVLVAAGTAVETECSRTCEPVRSPQTHRSVWCAFQVSRGTAAGTDPIRTVRIWARYTMHAALGGASRQPWKEPTWPYAMSWGTAFRTVSMGMANPTPTDVPVAVKMAVLTPITRPRESSSGPPELPGLMLASV